MSAEAGRLWEGRGTGEQGKEQVDGKGQRLVLLQKLSLVILWEGREAAQVLVLQGGLEALETPSSASTIP